MLLLYHPQPPLISLTFNHLHQNEEQWRSEKAEFQTTIANLEKLRDQLMSSKSCAHDNEFLSRQETTLNSVHEKLEARLLEKDKQIEQLQAQVS